MRESAKKFEFEKAAKLRDQVKEFAHEGFVQLTFQNGFRRKPYVAKEATWT